MTWGLPIPSGLAARALVALAVAAAGFAGGWAVNGWRLGATMATERQERAQEVADAARRALRVVEAEYAKRDALAAQLVAIDKTHSDNLTRLTHENEALRGRVAAGAVRVRVPGAVCPSRPADVPQAPAGSGVDSGTGAVLTPAAGQDFLDLRAAIIRAGEKLAACQQSLGRITGQLPESPR